MPSELVQRVRAKYPGAYDDLDDAQLEAAVLAKYPDYQDLATPKADFATTTTPADGLADTGLGVMGDLGLGVLKGAGQTATNLGRFVHMIPGVSRAVDALYGAPVSAPSFVEADKALTPTNTPQKIGKGLEQIGEFFIPNTAVEKAGAALPKLARAGLEAVTGAGVAAAQGASPVEAGISGVLSGAPAALGPSVKQLRATIAERLSAKAAKRVTEGLGATTKRLKNEAARIAPEFAERGLGGSLESLKEQATTQVDDLGRAIGATIKGEAGQATRPTQPIIAALEQAKGKLTTQRVGGAATGPAKTRADVVNALREGGDAIITDKPQYEALSKLQDVVSEYGEAMSVQQINALKKIYARVTSRSGGYQEKAGEILNTAPEAARTFAAILRSEENGVEALAKLNKEFRFWKGLQNVTTATVERRTSQTKGLTAAIAPVIGAASGASSGDSLTERASNALIGGVAGRKLTTALQSPQWKFVRARFATQLAHAVAESNPERVGQIVGKILAAEAAHVN